MKTSFIKALSLSVLVLVGTACLSFAADYDKDGKDDLESVRVIRSNRDPNAGETRWSVRRSSDGKLISYKFKVPGAALVRLKAKDKNYYPGIVWIKSLGEPLYWYIKNAKSQNLIKFGLPGDAIPNQADIDRDGIDDFTVVRTRQDGNLEWYTMFSKTEWAIRSTIFGTAGQKIFLGADGMLLTVSTDFQWSGKYFDETSASFSKQWGQQGDIPMAPTLKKQVAVARLGNPSQLYSSFENGSTQVATLGNANSVATMGKLTTRSISYGWHDRDRKKVYLKNPSNQKVTAVAMGDSDSAIILPSGQVIQPGSFGEFGTPTPAPTPTPIPTSTDGGNGGGVVEVPTNPGLSTVCPTIRSMTSGEVWKSIASTHIPATDPRRFSSSFITRRGTAAPSFTCLELYDARGNLIHKLGRYSPTGAEYSSRSYGGFGCGDLKTADSVARTAISNTGLSTSYLKVTASQCVTIPNPNSCINSSGC